MNLRAVRRRWLSAGRQWLRSTPVHPQWFVHGDQSGRLRHLHRLAGAVLDIGCADKALAALLPTGCLYFGLDHYATVRAFYGTRPDLYGDACQLPLQDGSMRGVMMFEVLEHVPEPMAALDEVVRVLQPGGVLLLSVPFLYPVHNAPYDFHRFTRHALQRALGLRGFSIESIEPRLRSLEVGGLLLNLALGDAALQIVRRFRWAIPAIPVIAAMVLAVNLGAWFLARVLPGSDFMPGGYSVVAVRGP